MVEPATDTQPDDTQMLDSQLVRLRFRGGPLTGAVLDLPADVAKLPDLQLIVIGDRVYDRRNNHRRIPTARVIRAPAASRTIVTAQPHPTML